jgi:predicted nucleotidyltransferase component of viral defense system
MRLPRIEDAPHKYQMYRLLRGILKDSLLSSGLVFKGGTCAVLRGWLDRFSVDLDFDVVDAGLVEKLRLPIRKLVTDLGFGIKDESKNHLQFFLKYPAPDMVRNTLKLEINDEVSRFNRWELANLAELNLMAQTQTRGTMVANKLVAALNRHQDHGSIAGRDFYDLRHFLSQGFEIETEIVDERMGMQFADYIVKLIDFVENTVTEKDLFEDLGPLLPATELKRTVLPLREELAFLLRGLL